MSVTVRQVARAIDLSYPTRRATRQRLREFIAARGGAVSADSSSEELVEAAAAAVDDSLDVTWLLLAVLSARLPRESDVVELHRLASLGGPRAAVRRALDLSPGLPGEPRRAVEVVSHAVLVDVDHTSTVRYATGIQRVTRETVARWDRDQELELVAWTADGTALRRLGQDARRAVVSGHPPRPRRWRDDRTVIVPWQSTYVIPELTILSSTGERRAALANWSRSRTVAIGFDMVPISSSETADPGMPAAFAASLTGVARADVVAAISDAAAEEYSGWVDMLSASGVKGPSVVSVPLGTDPSRPGSRDPANTRTTPLILCVGSHEPRKNHLAVLFAAERLWQEGRLFELVFVGGNAWHSDRFVAVADRLRRMGRPVSSRVALSDHELDELYRAARFTTFPSLHEGFGLPVVESLRRGTPVIATSFGSVGEIARAGGALLVDPRDDNELLEAMRDLLDDDDLRARLSAEAAARAFRTWDDYAAELWSIVIDAPETQSS